MLLLLLNEKPPWPISMASCLPRYTSRLEMLQKELSTSWSVPLNLNIALLFVTLFATNRWATFSVGEWRCAMVSGCGDWIGTITWMHPETIHGQCTYFEFWVLAWFSYHKIILDPSHIGCHWLSMYSESPHYTLCNQYHWWNNRCHFLVYVESTVVFQILYC